MYTLYSLIAAFCNESTPFSRFIFIILVKAMTLVVLVVGVAKHIFICYLVYKWDVALAFHSKVTTSLIKNIF
jgi:hypothetical protein